MNRKEAKKLAPIIKAFGDGKDVQYHSMDRHWITADEEYNPVFDSTVEWRVKPEPREFWIQIINMDDEKINGECWIKQAGWVGEGDELPDFNGEIVKVREIIGEGDENE